MKNACNRLSPRQVVIPEWAQQDPGYASAVTAPLGDAKLRFGMQQICGCTMLFVVSRTRVYLGKCTRFPREPVDERDCHCARTVWTKAHLV